MSNIKRKQYEEWLQRQKEAAAIDKAKREKEDEDFQALIIKTGKEALLKQDNIIGMTPQPLQPIELNKEIFWHLLSRDARRIYDTKLDNTVCEVTESIGQSIYSKNPQKPIRHATHVNYFQFLVEYDNEDYNLQSDIKNMARAFNYLVEQGFIDYGILAPISRLPLASVSCTWDVLNAKRKPFYSLEAKRREILFMFVSPSKYIQKKMYEGKPVEKLKELTGLPYWYNEGETPELKDWSALHDLLNNNG